MCITKPMSPSATSRGLLNGVDRPAIQIRWPMVTHRHSKVAAVRHVHVAASKVEASPAPVDRILANSQIKHSRAGFNADLVTSHTEQPTLFSPDAEFVQLGTTHRMGSRPFRASHVVAAASISPALPSTTMDVPPLKSLSKHPALPLLSLPTDAFIQVMHKVAAQQHALWQQVSVVAAEATKLTTIPDLAAALLRSSAAVTKSVQDQFHEDAARLQQAWVALQSRRGTLMELQAKVASLEAERESLQGQLDEARHRAQFAESSSAGLSVQLEEKKALSTLDDAAQVFRRHVCGVPLDLTPSQFHEHPDNVIGKGGCATVFKWRVGQTDWAVKSDPISYRHVMHEFDPQRCGDLLPAFLPPHPNIMAPKAWWVRSLALAQAQAISATPPAATTKTSSKPVTGFKLYTLYEKYTCSLWDFMQSMHTDQQKTNSTTPKAAANCPTAFNGGAFAAVAASEPLLLDLSSLLVVVRDVAAALEHLAVHRVVHGDVKAENVLLVLQPAPAGAEHTPQKVARAVLIDFGLCCMLPQGVDKMTARGGTWMYKAPEQMTGPPGIELGGQAMSAEPHVELQTDVWSLGLLICMLCNNGALPSKSGLPFGVPPEQLLKWGDRPKGVSHEPFWMSWDDVLPKMPGTPGAHQARLDNWDGCVEGCLPRGEGLERQHAHVMALLRRLAQGCLQKDPSQRPTAAQVRVAVAEALAGLSC